MEHGHRPWFTLSTPSISHAPWATAGLSKGTTLVWVIEKGFFIFVTQSVQWSLWGSYVWPTVFSFSWDSPHSLPTSYISFPLFKVKSNMHWLFFLLHICFVFRASLNDEWNSRMSIFKLNYAPNTASCQRCVFVTHKFWSRGCNIQCVTMSQNNFVFLNIFNSQSI